MDFVPGTVPVLSILTDSTIEQVESLDTGTSSTVTNEVDKKKAKEKKKNRAFLNKLYKPLSVTPMPHTKFRP